MLVACAVYDLYSHMVALRDSHGGTWNCPVECPAIKYMPFVRYRNLLIFVYYECKISGSLTT